jgi:hypothetical protein
MNKNFKIVQISGISGILLVGIIVTSVLCGFILFPVWLVMMGWNSVIAINLKIPVINFIQAGLLWSAVLITLYIILRNSISIRIQKDDSFEHKDIKEIITEIREKEDEKTEEEVHK